MQCCYLRSYDVLKFGPLWAVENTQTFVAIGCMGGKWQTSQQNEISLKSNK